MKKIFFFLLFVAISFLSGQTGTVLKTRTIYEDTTRVLSTNYGTLDTVHNKSRERYYRPVLFDSLLRGSQGFEFVGYDAGITYQSGARRTAFWYPYSASFRAGEVSGTAWNAANIGGYSVAFGLDNIASNTGSTVFGANNNNNGVLSTVFGGANTVTNGAYNFLSGGSSTTASGVSYTNLFGYNIRFLYGTIGGFAYSSSPDTISFGHATVSHGVPFVASTSDVTKAGGDELTSFALFTNLSADTSSWRWAHFLGQAGVGGTTTTSLNLIKSRNTDATNNHGLWNGTKYIIPLRIDTSNNIIFNATKTSDFNYGGIYFSNGVGTISSKPNLHIGADKRIYQSTDTTNIGGSGTLNTIAMFTGTSTLGNSTITQSSGNDAITFSGDSINAPSAMARFKTVKINASGSADMNMSSNPAALLVQDTASIINIRSTQGGAEDSTGIKIINASNIPVAGIMQSLSSGNFAIQVGSGAPTRLTIGYSTGDASFSKKMSTGGATTFANYGVPNIIDTIDYTVGSNIAAATIAGSATGWFEFHYSLKVVSSDVTAGSIQLTVTSNDGSAVTDQSALVALTAVANRDRNVFQIFNSSGNIQFSTAVTGIYGTSTYQLRAWVTRAL